METAPDDDALTLADDGREIELAPGDALTLRLESQPGTGFGWRVEKNDPELLRLVAGPVLEPRPQKEGPGALGASAYEVFRFKAERAGTNSLELHYARPWEKAKPPAKTFSIVVRIE